jgi:hypothetical protein
MSNAGIYWASVNGHVHVVDLLLTSCPQVNPTEGTFMNSASNGHVEVIKRLMQDPRCDTFVREGVGFICACESGQFPVVEAMLQDERTNPAAKDNEALRLASRNGRERVVKRLLKESRVDPTARKYSALRKAKALKRHRRTGIVMALLRDHRTDKRFVFGLFEDLEREELRALFADSRWLIYVVVYGLASKLPMPIDFIFEQIVPWMDVVYCGPGELRSLAAFFAKTRARPPALSGQQILDIVHRKGKSWAWDTDTIPIAFERRR